MATSSEKLARSIERLDRLKSEAAQLADIIASVLADGQPLLSLTRANIHATHLRNNARLNRLERLAHKRVSQQPLRLAPASNLLVMRHYIGPI